MLAAEGDRAGALEAYRTGLAIVGRLAAADPGNAGWQRDLSVSHGRIANMLAAEGDRAGALEAYRTGLAIVGRLAAADPGNAGWQRNLFVSHNSIGDMLAAEGDRAAALEAYRTGLAIVERLAAADPGNAGWQVDVLWSHWRLAIHSDDPVQHWRNVVDGLRTLRAANRLTSEQAGWLLIAEANLVKSEA